MHMRVFGKQQWTDDDAETKLYNDRPAKVGVTPTKRSQHVLIHACSVCGFL